MINGTKQINNSCAVGNIRRDCKHSIDDFRIIAN